MQPEEEPVLPGAGFAARIRHLTQPMLRIRYRGGVVVNAAGFPEWDLAGRAMVRLPEPERGLTIDELRVLDVLTANEAMVRAGDPLWSFTRDDYAALTPPGWVWAHRPFERSVVLVPAELHAAFRHAGGLAVLRWSRARRGVSPDDFTPVPMDVRERLSEDLLARLEEHLGCPLPPAYRFYLARTNGAGPTTPGVHPGRGFVVDQPLFGLSRVDRLQDLGYVGRSFTDRLTGDHLAIGYVQGGLLTVKVAGPDTGSVWYLDDDDPRDDDRYDAEHLCEHLLYRCADDFDAFWHALSPPPRRLLALVDGAVGAGRAVPVRPPELGASLAPARRPPA